MNANVQGRGVENCKIGDFFKKSHNFIHYPILAALYMTMSVSRSAMNQ